MYVGCHAEGIVEMVSICSGSGASMLIVVILTKLSLEASSSAFSAAARTEASVDGSRVCCVSSR